MATKSIGSSGRNYSTLALWAAYVNALALSAPEVGECYNDSEFTPAAQVSIGGWTGASATNTVTLKCAAGQSFRDNANVLTNALRYNQSNGVGINGQATYQSVLVITGDFMIVDGMQILADAASSTSGGIAQQIGAGATCVLQNCIIQGNSRNSGSGNGLVSWYGSTSTVQNNVIIVTASNGQGLGGLVAGTWYDNTVFTTNGSTGIGIGVNYGIAIAKNNVVAGFTTDYSGTCTTSANNATDKGSFGGTGWSTSGQVSLVAATEWQSVTAGSQDLRLKSTSAKLKDNGATVGPANDIAGTSRPQGSAYDIGCWELVAAASDTLFAQAWM